MWFTLKTKLNKPESLIELQGSYERFLDFFIYKNPTSKIEDIRGFAQKGFSKIDLESLDYLSELRMPNIPIFSQRFVEKMEHHLKNYMSFYPCLICHKNIEFRFFIGRIENILPVIDVSKSGFRLLTDGEKILSEPIAIRPDVNQNLMIVRDINYNTHFFVSSEFKDIAHTYELNIGYRDCSDSFW